MTNKSPPVEKQRWMFLAGRSHQFCSAAWQRRLWNKWRSSNQQDGEKKGEKHSVVRCVWHVSPFRQWRLSVTCTGSGKSVLGLLHEHHRDIERAARALRSAGSQTAEVAGKRRPAEEERWRNTLPPPPPPESADRAVRGFEINVDKVGWAPLPCLHEALCAKSQQGRLACHQTEWVQAAYMLKIQTELQRGHGGPQHTCWLREQRDKVFILRKLTKPQRSAGTERKSWKCITRKAGTSKLTSYKNFLCPHTGFNILKPYFPLKFNSKSMLCEMLRSRHEVWLFN